jgi:hypothetical protein
MVSANTPFVGKLDLLSAISRYSGVNLIIDVSAAAKKHFRFCSSKTRINYLMPKASVSTVNGPYLPTYLLQTPACLTIYGIEVPGPVVRHQYGPVQTGLGTSIVLNIIKYAVQVHVYGTLAKNITL